MPKMLIDGALEYEDGTPATEAQVGFPFYICYLVLEDAPDCKLRIYLFSEV